MGGGLNHLSLLLEFTYRTIEIPSLLLMESGQLM